MIKIDMYGDDGVVTETVTDIHICYGIGIAYPAVCEDCLSSASVDIPVYVWTTRTGAELTYSACAACLANDPFAKLVES